MVTVGLGTPNKDLTLVFDTGSDLTWTQCQPCLKFCYKQKDPIFSPTLSSTYSNVSCSSTTCSSLNSATGNSPVCSSSTCVYGIQYGDSSFSVGFFAKETLTSMDVFNNFLFGCGQNNQGLFGGAAGLLGLGRDKLSLPSQTSVKYNKIFSYCLPSSPSSTGFLRFGSGGISKSVKYTTLSTIPKRKSLYGINIVGISVGGKKLPISASIFTSGGTGAIIDSGTVITRLPPTAYSSLRSAFRRKMKQYPMSPPLSILDTCYDFSQSSIVRVPTISFLFNMGVGVPIHVTGIFYLNGISQVCLAFAGNRNDSDVTIFGNTQQKTLEVVYDNAKGRIGFGTSGCS